MVFYLTWCVKDAWSRTDSNDTSVRSGVTIATDSRAIPAPPSCSSSSSSATTTTADRTIAKFKDNTKILNYNDKINA